MLVVFDLDGTLLDGYAAIGDALGHAMKRLGLPEPSPAEVRSMVGHGLERLLEKAVGRDRAAEGVRLFRERYPHVALEKSELMPGVPAVMAELSRTGHTMALASNKPPEFSRMILDAKGIGRCFRSVGGPDQNTPAKPDPTMLFRILEETGGRPFETVVVGDMEVDAEMARAAACLVVLIPGGSRSREELASVDSDGLLDRLDRLPEWLEKQALGRPSS